MPTISNSARFVASGETVSGTVPVTALPRLADRLPEDMAFADLPPLAWSIRGTRDALGRPALEIRVEGTVPLACQRCLGRLDWSVTQNTTVLIAKTEQELTELDEASELEVVLCPEGIDTVSLVEDELLLSLPFAPMHEENNPDCIAKWKTNRGIIA